MAASLTEFFLARVAEDEGRATIDLPWETDGPDCVDCGDMAATNYQPSRVLAECDAKRRLVEDFEILHADYRATRSAETEARRFQALVAIAQLAIAYSDHPDYRQEWKP